MWEVVFSSHVGVVVLYFGEYLEAFPTLTFKKIQPPPFMDEEGSAVHKRKMAFYKIWSHTNVLKIALNRVEHVRYISKPSPVSVVNRGQTND